MSARAAAVAALQALLAERSGHAFSDPDLLEQALTHSSVGHGAKPVAHNERLEFLGDRVLNLVVAEALFGRFPGAREGDLALRFNAAVDAESCAEVARGWSLGPALRLPPDETRRGARERTNILADACEAVIAAVYLDGGLEAARALVLSAWERRLDGAPPAALASPKSRLQHWALARGPHLPRYEVVGREGPEHEPRFRVRVEVEGAEPAESEGASRRAAEAAAAAALLAREEVR